ncbi:hypothetical protein VTO42DRAFT_986 [Malbranchea cinnamomea]
MSLFLAEGATAVFNAYAFYDHDAVMAALGVSSECVSALNETVECDAVSAGRAARGEFDDYWTVDDITTLCTTECADSLSNWLSSVEKRCASENIAVNNFFLDPRTFPWQYAAGYNLVCLQDSAQNYCFYESQHWDDGVLISRASLTCSHEDPSKCLDPDVPAENVDVTDIYDRQLYCSECFLRLWRQQIMSPRLSSSGYGESLVNQFRKLEGDCLTMMPETMSPETLIINLAPPTTWISGNNSAKRAVMTENPGPYYTTAIPAVPTQPGTLYPCGHYYYVLPGDTCISVAERVGISYRELLSYNTKLDRDCRNLWANYAVCVAPVAKPPVTSIDRNENVTCEGFPFSSRCRNDSGRCDRCDPERPQQTEPPELKFPMNETSDEWEDRVSQNTTAEENSLENQPSEDAELPSDAQSRDNPTFISKDGRCNKYIGCVGSGFGDCCSTSGYCGTGPKWCGIGHCLSGKCDTEMGGQSVDGTCGPLFPGNKTCSGTEFGNCCSINGYCGSTEEYCGSENCYSGECFEKSL